MHHFPLAIFTAKHFCYPQIHRNCFRISAHLSFPPHKSYPISNAVAGCHLQYLEAKTAALLKYLGATFVSRSHLFRSLTETAGWRKKGCWGNTSDYVAEWLCIALHIGLRCLFAPFHKLLKIL